MSLTRERYYRKPQRVYTLTNMYTPRSGEVEAHWIPNARTGAFLDFFRNPASVIIKPMFESKIVKILEDLGFTDESIDLIRSNLLPLGPSHWGQKIREILPNVLKKSAASVMKKNLPKLLPQAIDALVKFIENKFQAEEKRVGFITNDRAISICSSVPYNKCSKDLPSNSRKSKRK